MSKLHLDLKAMPPVIAECARGILSAHGLQVCMPNGRPLTPDELEALFMEVGRNTSQSLFAIDSNPENA